MDIKNWRRSSSTRLIRLGRPGEALDQPAAEKSPSPNNKMQWKMLWRKFIKEKKKIFAPSARVHVQTTPYDTETYLQNFDQGQTLEEPDIVFRSFSMRYADPSKLFPQQKDLILL